MKESESEVTQWVWLFATLWTVAYQAPLSMEFSRQEYWSGLPFPSPGDLPDPGIEPWSPALQADALPSEPPGNPEFIYTTQENRPRSSFHVFSSVWEGGAKTVKKEYGEDRGQSKSSVCSLIWKPLNTCWDAWGSRLHHLCVACSCQSSGAHPLFVYPSPFLSPLNC